MAKIYRVIQIKLNQFKKMSMWSLTHQQTHLSANTVTNISQSFTYKMAAKSTGTDMEQKYVTANPSTRQNVKFSLNMVSLTLKVDKCLPLWLRRVKIAVRYQTIST